jgi:hypothetical protein
MRFAFIAGGGAGLLTAWLRGRSMPAIHPSSAALITPG